MTSEGPPVRDMYQASPVFRTLVVRARRRTYGRYQGRRPSWKKAIVTLKEGDAIEVFEG